MTILKVSKYLSPTGQVGQGPDILRIDCSNVLSDVTTAGFLTPNAIQPYSVTAKDLVMVSYSGGCNLFNVSIASNGTITLVSNSGVDVPLANTHILVGNASGIATDVALSGDATIANTGVMTIASSAITTAKIAAANVTLAKLATGITPSDIVVFSGRISWSGSGTSLTTAIPGVSSADNVITTIQTAPTQAAYIKSSATNTNQVIITLSAANTSNDAIIAFAVLRNAS